MPHVNILKGKGGFEVGMCKKTGNVLLMTDMDFKRSQQPEIFQVDKIKQPVEIFSQQMLHGKLIHLVTCGNIFLSLFVTARLGFFQLLLKIGFVGAKVEEICFVINKSVYVGEIGPGQILVE